MNSRDGQHGPWPRPGYAWYVVGLLFLAYAIAFVDRMVLNLLIEPIRLDLGLTDTQMGLLSGASFAIFYITLGLPIGWLADRASRRTIIAVGMVLWSVMTAACGLSRDFLQLFLARMGVGIGEATLSPSATSLISDYFPPDRLASGMAVYSSGISFGIGISLLVGGAVYESVNQMALPALWGLATLQSWQVTFLVVATPGVLLAFVMYTVREPERRGVSATRPSTFKAEMIEVIAFAKKNRSTIAAIFVTFCMTSILTYGTSAWMAPYFMRVHGWTVGEVGWTYGWIMLICGPGGTLAGGWLADRLRRQGHLDARLQTTCYAMLALTPLAAIAPILPSVELALPAIAIFWFIASMPLSLGYAAVQEIAPNEMRGQLAAALLFMATIAGMGFGPTAIALLTDYVFEDPMDLAYSISITACVAAAAAAVAAASGRRALRTSVAAAKHWQSNMA